METALGLVLCCVIMVSVVTSNDVKQISKEQTNSEALRHQITRRGTGYLFRNLAKRQLTSNVLPGSGADDVSRQADKLMDDFMMFLTLRDTGMLERCLGI